jgi:hypothetical protein
MMHRHRPTKRGQVEGDGAADPARRTGDEGGFRLLPGHGEHNDACRRPRQGRWTWRDPPARAKDGGGSLAHGLFIYLMGADGRLLTLLPPVMDAETMAATIRRYMS